MLNLKYLFPEVKVVSSVFGVVCDADLKNAGSFFSSVKVFLSIVVLIILPFWTYFLNSEQKNCG